MLHGCRYMQGPKADILYNVLYGMGIYPNVKVFPFEHKNRFENIEEALEHFKPQYAVSSPEQEEILRSYLQEVLVEENRALVQKGQSTRAKMWWKVSSFRGRYFIIESHFSHILVIFSIAIFQTSSLT